MPVRILYFMDYPKGQCCFSADLMRYLNVNVSLDFMQVSSYGSSSVSGELKILKDGQIDVNGKM